MLTKYTTEQKSLRELEAFFASYNFKEINTCNAQVCKAPRQVLRCNQPDQRRAR